MKKILIVEDDFYISKLYQRTFNLAGFDVDIAISGKQALEKSQSGTYDVILLDVMLGDMSGLDVLKIWRAPDHRFVSTPVFLSTNRGEDAIIKEGFALGMEGYFFKSQYVPQDIVNEINTFFARQGDVPAASAAPPVPVAPSPSAPVSDTLSSAPQDVVTAPGPVPAVVEPIISPDTATLIPVQPVEYVQPAATMPLSPGPLPVGNVPPLAQPPADQSPMPKDSTRDTGETIVVSPHIDGV